MPSDVILIGPIRAGKSAIGELLSESLCVPQISMDEECQSYYQELELAEAVTRRTGTDNMISSFFKLHALERLLQSYQGCVIDLGAGHSVFPDTESLDRAKAILDSYPNVFLLLPSPDVEVSAKILAERNVSNVWLNEIIRKHGVNPNDQFLCDKSNFVLAKYIIYTNGKSPLETCKEILDHVDEKPIYGPFKLSDRKIEIVEMLSTTLEKAKKGSVRSIVIITTQYDDEIGRAHV